MSFIAIRSLITTIFFCIALRLAFIRVSRWTTRRALIRKYGCKEPPSYPHKDPKTGLDLIQINTLAAKDAIYLDTTARLFEQNGKTHKIKFFHKTIIRTCDPEVSKAVFSTQFDKFGLQPIRYEEGMGFFGKGILVMDGAHWKKSRALIRPAFDIAHVANFDRLSRHVHRFLKILPHDGATIDLLPLFKRLTLDLSSEFIFGKSMNALSSPDACKSFIHAFVEAQRGVVTPKADRAENWAGYCKEVWDYIDKCVDEAIARVSGTQSSDEDANHVRLIDELLKATQNREVLRDLVLSVFSPAHDTVAITLSNLFFHLARNPGAWKKVRAEIMPTASQPLTNELLNSYKYLNWALRETHRLTPLAPASQRECLTTTVILSGGGHDGKSPLFVEKGTIIETNFRLLQRDKSYWGSNAESFYPDRWESIRPTWEYTPFSGGPRICPAFKLVYTESGYITVALLREFAILENRDPVNEWVEERRLVFQSRNGTKVGLIR